MTSTDNRDKTRIKVEENESQKEEKEKTIKMLLITKYVEIVKKKGEDKEIATEKGKKEKNYNLTCPNDAFTQRQIQYAECYILTQLPTNPLLLNCPIKLKVN